MTNFKNNKRAAIISEGTYWLLRFVLISIFAGAVILILIAHYSRPFDVRDAESAILAQKTINCIKPELFLTEDSFINSGNRISSCIEIPKDDEKKIFINATLSNFTDNLKPYFQLGNEGLGIYFGTAMCNTVASSPSCTEYRYYAINETGSQFIIDIKIINNKNS